MNLPRGEEAAPAARTAVLLVNLGTPAAPTAAAVRAFLGEFLRDPRVVDAPRWWWLPLLNAVILPLRSGRAARNYASIWMAEGSPLQVYSERLAAGVQREMPGVEVVLAMRYGAPSVATRLDALRDRGVQRLVVLPLYPQYSTTTTASVQDAVRDYMNDHGDWETTNALVADYHDDAGWLDALAASVRAHWDAHGRGERLLVSFHGLPQRLVDRGDPYAAQCEATASALAARLGLDPAQWQLTYQSRFGREPWLGPATVDVLDGLAARGVRTVDVVCPGFAVDCLETLEEVAMAAAGRFAEKGGTLRYVPALNDDPAHAAALAALVRRQLEEATE